MALEFFFDKGELGPAAANPDRMKGDGKRHDCSTCGLDQDCQSPHLEPCGKGRSKIAIVDNAPGEEEDQAGRPAVDGDAFRL